jgi:CubicO group peptidase (beta-lactamase class C family)
MQGGKLVCERGLGVAKLEYDVPITPQTVFHVASVSKQFTAMALVLLKRDGKSSLLTAGGGRVTAVRFVRR